MNDDRGSNARCTEEHLEEEIAAMRERVAGLRSRLRGLADDSSERDAPPAPDPESEHRRLRATERALLARVRTLSDETGPAPARSGWPSITVVLIVLAILAGGLYALLTASS